MKHLNFRIYSLILACTCMVGCAEQFDEAGQADKAHMLGIAVLAEIGDSGRELPELAVTMTNPDENYTVQGTIKNCAVTVLNDVMPGIYNVTVSGRSSDGIFAGGLNGIELFETRGTDNPLRIPIKITEGPSASKRFFTIRRPVSIKKTSITRYTTTATMCIISTICASPPCNPI